MQNILECKKYIVGIDDSKIHKILNKRERCIFKKINVDRIKDTIVVYSPLQENLQLISHSIFHEKNEGHTILRFCIGCIDLNVGDIIIIDNLDFYIICINEDNSRTVAKFKFVKHINYFISYSTTNLNDIIKL